MPACRLPARVARAAGAAGPAILARRLGGAREPAPRGDGVAARRWLARAISRATAPSACPAETAPAASRWRRASPQSWASIAARASARWLCGWRGASAARRSAALTRAIGSVAPRARGCSAASSGRGARDQACSMMRCAARARPASRWSPASQAATASWSGSAFQAASACASASAARPAPAASRERSSAIAAAWRAAWAGGTAPMRRASRSVRCAASQSPARASRPSSVVCTQAVFGRSARARRASDSAPASSPDFNACEIRPRRPRNSVSGFPSMRSKCRRASSSSPTSCAACAASSMVSGGSSSSASARLAWRRASCGSPAATATSPLVSAA